MSSVDKTGEGAHVWDQGTQTYHGGQDWKLLGDTYVCDFSVTTNALGTPEAAIKHAASVLERDVLHYPSADFEPAITELANWLVQGIDSDTSVRSRLLMGNGLSELIDLITRVTPQGPWRSAPYYTQDGKPLQYKEYERSASAYNRRILSARDANFKAEMTAIVNPSNPTGDYMTIAQLEAHIEANVANGTVVLIDESMLPWHGADWRQHSLLSRRAFIDDQLQRRNVKVYILHSWTKIWSCPGIRLGSVVCPSADALAALKRIQVPWSLNTAALAFTERVVHDVDYMQRTWSVTTEWRDRTVKRLAELFPTWTTRGERWLSWIWVETDDEMAVDKLYETCLANGVPIRSGKFGYDSPHCFRLAVRAPEFQDKLFDVLERVAAQLQDRKRQKV